MMQGDIAFEQDSPIQIPHSSQTPLDPAGQRWTELEIFHLIDAYQERWYALKRGQLKARHWEHVANTVCQQCGGIEPAKSSVQCRHKIEKLRRKYRCEKQLEEQRGPGASRWPYFERFDMMERGPGNGHESLRVGGVPGGIDSGKILYFDLDLQEAVGRNMQDRESTMSLDEDIQETDNPHTFHESLQKRPYQDANENENDNSNTSLSKKPHSFVEKEDAPSRMEGGKLPRVSGRPTFKRRRMVDSAPISELASVVRSLGEGFLRIEHLKLEMQRDNERLRAEMELKRTSLVLESQKQIAELFSKALSRKKATRKQQTQDT